ncbi:FtsX-like permease family protein [Zafaria sp. J156]|uniref:ABC transporter permease n=1 Tax=Zafaria sp. J156 TaxID=3116490 RepID=UPI002E798E66|nr:ABC transporter permease [Zafaria sp. J156]MEE1620525.1 ABC transporter permease [Zafaria sp. J156]
MLARLLVRYRSQEALLLVSRGTAPGQTTALAAAESAVPAVAGALAGWGLGAALLPVLARWRTGAPGGYVPLLGEAAAVTWWVPVAAAGTGVVLATGAALLAALRSLPDTGTALRRLAPVGYVLGVLGAGAAALSTWQLLTTGSPLNAGAAGGANPVAAPAPALLIVGLCLAAVGLGAAAVRLADPLLGRFPGMPAVLAGRTLARSFGYFAVPALLVALTLSSAAFSASFTATGGAAQHAAGQLGGGTVRAAFPGPGTVRPGAGIVPLAPVSEAGATASRVYSAELRTGSERSMLSAVDSTALAGLVGADPGIFDAERAAALLGGPGVLGSADLGAPSDGFDGADGSTGRPTGTTGGSGTAGAPADWPEPLVVPEGTDSIRLVARAERVAFEADVFEAPSEAELAQMTPAEQNAFHDMIRRLREAGQATGTGRALTATAWIADADGQLHAIPATAPAALPVVAGTEAELEIDFPLPDAARQPLRIAALDLDAAPPDGSAHHELQLRTVDFTGAPHGAPLAAEDFIVPAGDFTGEGLADAQQQGLDAVYDFEWADGRFTRARFIAAPIADAPVPAILSAELAGRIGTLGGPLGAAVGGTRLQLDVAGTAPVLPGLPTASGVLVDWPRLQAAYLHHSPVQPRPNQLWASPADGSATAGAASAPGEPTGAAAGTAAPHATSAELGRILAALPGAGAVDTAEAAAPQRFTSPARDALWIGFAGILLLGGTALAAATLALVHHRRRETSILRALGLSAAAQVRSRRLELALVGGTGVVCGTLVGLGTAALTATLFARSALVGAPAEMPVPFLVDWPVLAAAAAVELGAVATCVWWYGRAVGRHARSGELAVDFR